MPFIITSRKVSFWDAQEQSSKLSFITYADLDPARPIPCGGEPFVPVASNTTEKGKPLNLGVKLVKQ